MKLSFTKMQGCANDYIYLDCRTSGVPEQIAALSERLSRRHFSIGADGIICICAPVTAGADAMMRIFNADGSEGKMCGNGIRCVAEWLYTHGMAKPKLAIDTLSGLKTVARMGVNGQSFAFNGYLPVKPPERTRAIRFFERRALSEGQSQLFIEAPYRNVKLMEQLVQTLGDQTRLTVAVDLTAPDERIETHTAGEWRRRQLPEMNRRPAIFIIG